MDINDPIDALMAYLFLCAAIAFIVSMIWAGIQTWKDRYEIK